MKINITTLYLLLFTSHVYCADQSTLKPDIIHLKDRTDLITEVAKLWWLGQGNNQQHFSESQVEPMVNYLRSNATSPTTKHCLIALLGSALVGKVQLVDVWTDDPNIIPKVATHPEWTPWIRGLVVHPEYRKQGIGSALLKAAEKKAQELGFSRIYLGSEPELEESYKKHGYTSFEKDIFRGEKTIILMDKSLQNALEHTS